MCQTLCAKCFAFITSFKFLTSLWSRYYFCSSHTCGNWDSFQYVTQGHQWKCWRAWSLTAFVYFQGMCSIARLAPTATVKEPYPPTSSSFLPPTQARSHTILEALLARPTKRQTSLQGGNIRVLEFQRRLPEYEESSSHREGNNPEADVSKSAKKVLAGEEEQEEHREQKQVLSPQRGQWVGKDRASLEAMVSQGWSGSPHTEAEGYSRPRRQPRLVEVECSVHRGRPDSHSVALHRRADHAAFHDLLTHLFSPMSCVLPQNSDYIQLSLVNPAMIEAWPILGRWSGNTHLWMKFMTKHSIMESLAPRIWPDSVPSEEGANLFLLPVSQAQACEQ